MSEIFLILRRIDRDIVANLEWSSCLRLVVFKFVSWYSNSSRGIQIRLVVFKFVSWHSNSSRGIQIRLVVFKFVSWHSNSSRGGQIRLSGIQISLSFKVNSLRQYCG